MMFCGTSRVCILFVFECPCAQLSIVHPCCLASLPPAARPAYPCYLASLHLLPGQLTPAARPAYPLLPGQLTPVARPAYPLLPGQLTPVAWPAYPCCPAAPLHGQSSCSGSYWLSTMLTTSESLASSINAIMKLFHSGDAPTTTQVRQSFMATCLLSILFFALAPLLVCFEVNTPSLTRQAELVLGRHRLEGADPIQSPEPDEVFLLSRHCVRVVLLKYINTFPLAHIYFPPDLAQDTCPALCAALSGLLSDGLRTKGGIFGSSRAPWDLLERAAGQVLVGRVSVCK